MRVTPRFLAPVLFSVHWMNCRRVAASSLSRYTVSMKPKQVDSVVSHVMNHKNSNKQVFPSAGSASPQKAR